MHRLAKLNLIDWELNPIFTCFCVKLIHKIVEGSFGATPNSPVCIGFTPVKSLKVVFMSIKGISRSYLKKNMENYLK